MVSDEEVWSACPIVFACREKAVHQMNFFGGVDIGWRFSRIAGKLFSFSTLHLFGISDRLTESTFSERVVKTLVAKIRKDLFRLEALYKHFGNG